jgi:hypothetical protein
LKEVDLFSLYPRLWHMAEDGSFDSILRHGLLSTSALLDLYAMEGEERRAIERMRRPESVPLKRKGLPSAIVRDNKPMTASALEKCLTRGVKPEEWFAILNGRSFFWLSKKRLNKLLNARAYRDRPQTVLTVDTKSLVEAHRKNVELSPLNSGATIYKPQPRGRDTFKPIADYPFEQRRREKGCEFWVVELVVLGGVPDIKDHLIAAHRVYEGEKKELWRREGASADEGP